MGIPVRARNTIKRNGVYLPPGTVFELPDREAVDRLVARGVVVEDLASPIAATPEYEITPNGAKREAPAEAAPDAPPASFADEPPGVSTPGAGQRRGRSR